MKVEKRHKERVDELQILGEFKIIGQLKGNLWNLRRENFVILSKRIC